MIFAAPFRSALAILTFILYNKSKKKSRYTVFHLSVKTVGLPSCFDNNINNSFFIIFYVNRFSSGFITALQDRKVFIIAFILSFLMWGLDMARMYVCFGSLGTYPPIIPLVIIYTIGILISLLPLLPGAWGIREATLIGLFAVVGVSADVVMAASIIDRLASYIAPTLIGALAALHYGRKVKNKSNDSLSADS